MFFWTGYSPELCATIRKGEGNLTFDNCFDTGVEAKRAVPLNVEFNMAFTSSPSVQAPENIRSYQGKRKAHNDMGKACSSRGMTLCSHDFFCG
jgi:hypothetical protein